MKTDSHTTTSGVLASAKQGRVSARRFGRRLRIGHLRASLAGSFSIEVFPDAVLLKAPDAQAVCFATGIVVNWGSDSIVHVIESNAGELFENIYEARYEQVFEYVNTKELGVEDDRLHIDVTDPKAVVIFSHALARSVQLEYNESLIEAVYEHTADLPHNLRDTGHIQLSSKKIKKLVGLVLEAQYGLSTFGVANDRPEILWEEVEYEAVYKQVAFYLELHDRWSVLTEKISVLESTLDILRDEINTKQSHFLEWIIIIFFAIDIVYIAYEVFFRHQ